MKKLAVLIDFTPVSNEVVDFAIHLAIEKQVELNFIHVYSSHHESEIHQISEKLKAFVTQAESKGITAKHEIHQGEFFSIIKPILKNANASMVLIGTHGKKGIMQNIFGSHILKLVQLVGIPSLVIQENVKWPAQGFKKVLSPISSHDNFISQINQTHSILSTNGEIDIYAIHRNAELAEQSQKNLSDGKNALESLGVIHSIIEEDVTVFSIGYAKQTLEFLRNNPYDLVSIMSQISEESQYFGEVDKENIILNPMGIPVLCCDE